MGRDSDKGHGLGGPNVERQVFGVLLTFFVVLFAFSGLSARCLLSAQSSLIILLHFKFNRGRMEWGLGPVGEGRDWREVVLTVGSVRNVHSRGGAVKRRCTPQVNPSSSIL